MTVYGAATNDGKRLFRTYVIGFDTKILIRYVAEMKQRFRRIAVALDKAPPYRSKALRRKFGRDGDVRLVNLPRGSPHLNMIEGRWRQAKHHLLVSEYYPVFADMRRAVSEYLGASKLKLDMYAYSDRWAAPILNNL